MSYMDLKLIGGYTLQYPNLILYCSSRRGELCPGSHELLHKYTAMFAVSRMEYWKNNSSVKLDLHQDAHPKLNIMVGLE